MAITSTPITDRLLKLGTLDISQVSDYSISEKKEVKNNTVNMRGDLRQTILGNRVVIDVTLRVMNRTELTPIIAKLLESSIDVTYFDPRNNTTREAAFVASGFDTTLLDKRRGYYEPFKITLTAISIR